MRTIHVLFVGIRDEARDGKSFAFGLTFGDYRDEWYDTGVNIGQFFSRN